MIYNKDILYKIAEYLPFENKVIFGKYCKINFLIFYDFNSLDFQSKTLFDLFEDDIGDNLFDLKYSTIDYQLVLQEYIEYNKKTYIENNLKYFYLIDNDTYIDIDNYNNTDDFINKICNIPINDFIHKIDYYNNPYPYYIKYGEINRFNNIFEEELDDILNRSIYLIYIRFLIELIEEHNINIKYDNKMNIFNLDELDELLYISIDDKITTYYISSFENKNIDINVICSRCGLFGHCSLSKTCIFYDKNFEKKEIINIIDDILDNVDYIIEKKLRIKRREITLCKSINCDNIKSDRCLFNRCKRCCKDLECIFHINRKNKALKYKLLYAHINNF